jgi:hypothetical protein
MYCNTDTVTDEHCTHATPYSGVCDDCPAIVQPSSAFFSFILQSTRLVVIAFSSLTRSLVALNFPPTPPPLLPSSTSWLRRKTVSRSPCSPGTQPYNPPEELRLEMGFCPVSPPQGFFVRGNLGKPSRRTSGRDYEPPPPTISCTQRCEAKKITF